MKKAAGVFLATVWVAFLCVGIPFGAYILFGSNNSDDVEQSQQNTQDVTDDSEYVEKHGTSDCTEDCSGHDAGYEWARENDICDAYYDHGNSESFNEGVIAYAYDNCYYSDDGNPI